VRSLARALLALALVSAGCGDDDEPRAAGTTTTLEDVECASTEPTDVVATHGDLTFAVVDTGASVDVLAVYVEADCGLAPLQLDREEARLAIGGSVTHAEGIACLDDGGLAVLSATSDDGETYDATRVTYELVGVSLVEVDRETATIDATSDAAALDPYYRLDC